MNKGKKELFYDTDDLSETFGVVQIVLVEEACSTSASVFMNSFTI